MRGDEETFAYLLRGDPTMPRGEREMKEEAPPDMLALYIHNSRNQPNMLSFSPTVRCYERECRGYRFDHGDLKSPQ